MRWTEDDSLMFQRNQNRRKSRQEESTLQGGGFIPKPRSLTGQDTQWPRSSTNSISNSVEETPSGHAKSRSAGQ